jgi:hypothetical protein
MTDDRVTLWTLREMSVDADVLRELIGFVAHRPLVLEVGGRAGAGDLRRLKLREGNGLPFQLDLRWTAEKPLAAVIPEAGDPPPHWWTPLLGSGKGLEGV